MADKTTWEVIDNKIQTLRPLYDRMDKSRDLAYMEPYTLVGFDGKPVDNIVNVTGNKAAVFGNTIISDLAKAEWQTVVEGSIGKRDAHRIEEFTEDCLGEIDEYLLAKYGITGLHEWLCNHVCIRGPIGVEYISWVENKEYKIHCMPLDMRYAPFQYGENGLAWIAPISFKNREEIEAQYPEVKQVTGTNDDVEIRDYWNDKVNELWVEKKQIYSEPHKFGKPPAIIAFPPSGFMLRDKNYIKHEGEDIFYLIRGINDEINRTMSIEQSLIFNVLRPPMEREVENPDASPSIPTPVTGESLDVAKGERHIPIPTGDMNRANLMAHQDLFEQFTAGALTAPRAYTQAPSGAELLLELEALQKLQNSRVTTLRVFREQLARMMIEQFILIGQGANYEIGKIGRRRNYSAVQLRDPKKYSISCQLMTKNKRQELANLAMFSAAYGRLPLRYNLENVLMAEDPDGIIEELEIEQAKKADPVIGLYEMARAYARQAVETEDEAEADALKIQSMMLTERGVSILKQRQQPMQPQLPEKARVPQTKELGAGQLNSLLPLMGETGLPSGRPPNEEAQ